MKKHYISPEIISDEMAPDSLLANSITGVDKGDLNNPITVGGEAGDGETSDSRFSVWDDEE